MLMQLENTLNEYFGQKAPALPMGLKEFLVKIAPYLVILGVISGVLGLLSMIGWGSFGYMRMMSYGYPVAAGAWGVRLTIYVILNAISVILEALAISGLFKRSLIGWRYIFYCQLVGLLGSLVMYNIIGLVISALIGFYILFQLRPLYH